LCEKCQPLAIYETGIDKLSPSPSALKFTSLIGLYAEFTAFLSLLVYLALENFHYTKAALLVSIDCVFPT